MMILRNQRVIAYLKVVLASLVLGVSCIASLDASITAAERGTCENLDNKGECVQSQELLDLDEMRKKVLAFHGGKTTGNDLAYTDLDHLECDIETLGITDEQKQLCMDAFNSANVQDPAILEMAASTNFRITPHTAYRYYASAGWTPTYHGDNVNDSIVATVRWRSEYGINNIDPIPLRPMIEKGLCYIDRELDIGKRPIIYVKTMNLTNNQDDIKDYVKLLMFTINRADVIATSRGVGEFVAIVDMDGFAFSKSPSIASLKELMHNLKKHFAYRLHAVYIVNTSMAFSMLWRIFKPILPKRAIDKTHILNKKETAKIMKEKVGLDHIEEDYGGTKARGYAITDIDAYLEPSFIDL